MPPPSEGGALCAVECAIAVTTAAIRSRALAVLVQRPCRREARASRH